MSAAVLEFPRLSVAPGREGLIGLVSPDASQTGRVHRVVVTGLVASRLAKNPVLLVDDEHVGARLAYSADKTELAFELTAPAPITAGATTTVGPRIPNAPSSPGSTVRDGRRGRVEVRFTLQKGEPMELGGRAELEAAAAAPAAPPKTLEARVEAAVAAAVAPPDDGRVAVLEGRLDQLERLVRTTRDELLEALIKARADNLTIDALVRRVDELAAGMANAGQAIETAAGTFDRANRLEERVAELDGRFRERVAALEVSVAELEGDQRVGELASRVEGLRESAAARLDALEGRAAKLEQHRPPRRSE